MNSIRSNAVWRMCPLRLNPAPSLLYGTQNMLCTLCVTVRRNMIWLRKNMRMSIVLSFIFIQNLWYSPFLPLPLRTSLINGTIQKTPKSKPCVKSKGALSSFSFYHWISLQIGSNSKIWGRRSWTLHLPMNSSFLVLSYFFYTWSNLSLTVMRNRQESWWYEIFDIPNESTQGFSLQSVFRLRSWSSYIGLYEFRIKQKK